MVPSHNAIPTKYGPSQKGPDFFGSTPAAQNSTRQPPTSPTAKLSTEILSTKIQFVGSRAPIGPTHSIGIMQSSSKLNEEFVVENDQNFDSLNK